MSANSSQLIAFCVDRRKTVQPKPTVQFIHGGPHRIFATAGLLAS